MSTAPLTNRTRSSRLGLIGTALLVLATACSEDESATCASSRCSEPPSDGGTDGHPQPREDAEPNQHTTDTGFVRRDGALNSADSMSADGGGAKGDAGGETRSDALPISSPCDDGSDCQTGHCSARVCCDTECSERFFSCKLAGTEGTCSALMKIFVDPLTGNDNATGTADDPLKTLKTALSAAKSGWTVYLEPGTYEASSGEDWSTKVADGVTIQAVVEGNAILRGLPSDTALDLLGGSDVKGLTFKGFANAVSASTGNLSIGRSTIDTGGGLRLAGNVKVTLDNTVLQNLSDDGISTSGIADVQMNGGSIGGIGYVTSCAGASAIHATDSSNVHLLGVTVHDFGGNGVETLKAATVTLTDGVVTKTGQTDCGGAQLVASEASTISLDHTSVTDGNSDGLHTGGVAHVNLDGVTIGAHPGVGIYCGSENVVVTGGSIQSSKVGAYLAENCACTIDGTSIEGNTKGIELQGSAFLKLRNANVFNGDYAVYAATASPVRINLGESNDPGANALAGATRVLTLSGVYYYDTTFNIVGNTWIPSVQGASASGKYASQVVNGPVSGRNFSVAGSNVHLQL